METLLALIDQVRAILIQTEGQIPKHEIYNQFINECTANNLTEDDFYKKILKEAYKSIDPDYFEKERKRKEATQIKLNEELAEEKSKIESAPIYIDRLIKIAFEDGVVESDELVKIFNKAKELHQDIQQLALKIDSKLDEERFKSYPRANFDAVTLKETLTSTNWYNEKYYLELTTVSAPPPPPFPWKKIIAASVLILSAIAVVGYFVWYKPYLKDKNATRMYSYANSLALRSSPAAGGNYNAVDNLLYGTEILVYSINGDWAECKANSKNGYVSTQFLVSKKDFQELNGILADPDTRDAISTTKCRRALLNYFSSKGIIGKIDAEIQKEIYGSVQQKEVWQVFTKPKNSNPNNVAYPRVFNPNSKYSDFACIIKNVVTGKRKFLLFSFTDDEKETLQSEQEAPPDGYIQTISRYPYKVKYAL